ncbi:hypothetical protein H2204_004446 [Knufia peltigerae]|uniref:Histone-lysine N-methyltransferase n=1 Tax=Knufia peltigerae TaxID=1002370 RepID=A0AA38Y7L2_9EURO|nr:hypothetical protein H2204_004446 [Knufia peltigerae]
MALMPKRKYADVQTVIEPLPKKPRSASPNSYAAATSHSFTASNGSHHAHPNGADSTRDTYPSTPPRRSTGSQTSANQKQKLSPWGKRSPYAHRIKEDHRPSHKSTQDNTARSRSSTQRLMSVDIPSRNVPLRPSRGPPSPVPVQRRPTQSRIEVVVSPSQQLLAAFRGPKPRSIPERRKAMLKELKKGPNIALQNPQEARELFGTCLQDFNRPRSDDVYDQRLRKLASKKARKVSRTTRLPSDESLNTSMRKLGLGGGELIHPAETARQILTSRFDEYVNPPLTFANDVNQRRLQGKFQFVDRYIFSCPGIKTAPPSTNYGCDCVHCHSSTCLCSRKDWKDEATGQKYTKQIPTYTRRSDGLVVLSEEYIDRELDPSARHFEITECNELCGCGPACWNRVVGNGRTLSLEIFETAKCGFGVRSTTNIAKGQFIDLYLGEVITEEELRNREDAAAEDEPSYIYTMDWFGGDSYHIDGKNFGSAMRFANHSCNPNARSFIVQIHKGDKRVYYLPFFAIKDIAAGTEITIDYKSKHDDGDDDEDQLDAEAIAGVESGDPDLADGLIRCHCGEKNCRKFLWKPGVKARRRKRKPE